MIYPDLHCGKDAPGLHARASASPFPIDWTPERRSRFDEALVTLGRLDSVVRELTARKRNRLFRYSPYVEIMKQGTDPPDS